MKKMNCHICDYQGNEAQEGQPPFCVRCGADLSDPTLETKLMEAPPSATYATADRITALRMQTSIYLTDKRLILVPAKLSGFGLAGVLTAATYNKMTTASGVISIPFENVKDVRDGKFGLLVKALIVDTTDGEMVKITAPKRNVWKDALMKATGL